MRAVFLDRDGVINNYPGDTKYIVSWNDFHFLPGVKEAIAKLTKEGFRIFVISNQAGVSKGIYSQQELDGITRNMLKEIAESGGQIEEVYYCTHRDEDNCSCRKPKAGLIDKIKEKYPIEPNRTFFIGDTIRDVKTARAGGCKSILVLSGKEKTNNPSSWEVSPDYVFADLSSAAEFILKQKT
jgi:D-glycero-D-manno-heptose 1,7-bisphosphate phosphatase